MGGKGPREGNRQSAGDNGLGAANLGYKGFKPLGGGPLDVPEDLTSGGQNMSSPFDRQLGGNNSMESDDGTSLLSGVGVMGAPFSQLGGLSQAPQIIKDMTNSERRHNLELLETSFKNILTK